jgi:hypothetical protein
VKAQAGEQEKLSNDASKADMRPVCAGQHGANQPDKYDEQDHAAATSAASAAPKTKPVLHPIKNGVDKKELEQARKTSGAVIHSSLLQVSNR